MSAQPRRPNQAPSRRLFPIMGAMLTLSAGCFVAGLPSPASAQSPAPGFEGRWVQESRGCTGPDCRRSYDFAPCGKEWCGVEVKDGKECGRVAFRLKPNEENIPGTPELTGRFERTPGAETYTVRVSLRLPSAHDAQPASTRLFIVGNTGDKLELFRRTFPLYMVLQREGDPTCKAENSVS